MKKKTLKKALAIFIVIALTTVVYVNTSAAKLEQTAQSTADSDLEILLIRGGLGIKAILKNNGQTSIENIQYRVSVGSHGAHYGEYYPLKEKEDSISCLDPGEQKTISTGFFFGFGIKTAFAGVKDPDHEEQYCSWIRATAFVLGPFAFLFDREGPS